MEITNNKNELDKNGKNLKHQLSLMDMLNVRGGTASSDDDDTGAILK